MAHADDALAQPILVGGTQDAAGVTHGSAPGRVNLMGEHTDYNGGFVLPTAIPQRTRVELLHRSDQLVNVHTTSEPAPASYVLGHERRRGDWLDYVQGITWSLRGAGFQMPAGMDLNISSDVPLGAGVSSSAALEVALLRALRQAFTLDGLDDVRLAQLGQLAENDFVGARCGIMDQMAASLADLATALFLDTRSLTYRRVPLPADADLVVVHSGVSHAVAGGEYNTRRAECERAATLLGVPQLRDVSVDGLPASERLPEPLGRRVRHIVTENARVLDTVAALDSGDLTRVGQLFVASHVSMRDDFEVSAPEVDLLVELATSDPAVYGARMTGGGFGGAVVMLAQHDQGIPVASRVARRYAEESGRTPKVLVPTNH